MTSEKTGPLKRLAKALGLGRTTGGARIPYARCWGCSQGRHGAMYDNTCGCCRSNHV